MTSGPKQKDWCIPYRVASRSCFKKSVNRNIRSTKIDHGIRLDQGCTYKQKLWQMDIWTPTCNASSQNM